MKLVGTEKKKTLHFIRGLKEDIIGLVTVHASSDYATTLKPATLLDMHRVKVQNQGQNKWGQGAPRKRYGCTMAKPIFSTKQKQVRL